MDNINNNMVGDNQNNNMGQGINDVNNGSTPVQSNDYNSMQPTPSPIIVDDMVGSLTGMPTPEVSNAPIGVQPVQESTPPIMETPVEESIAPSFGSSPASIDTTISTPMDTVTPTPMEENTPLSQPMTETIPSLDSNPVINETVYTTPIEESIPVAEVTPVLQPIEESTPIVEASPVVDSAPAFETPAPETISSEPSTPESTPTEMGAQSLSQPLPSFAPPSDTPMPVTQGEEVVSNLEDNKEVKSGKGGTAVVIVLIIVIVALLATIGYFAYKIFIA